eukprot:SAG31_NODE_505_length_14757_cov_20.172943_9_plen_48_part_00
MCSSRAAARAKQPVELYAIEKNPNAVVYLEQLKVRNQHASSATDTLI